MRTRLITTYFRDKHAPRRHEVSLCLGLNNEFVDEFIVIAENCPKPPVSLPGCDWRSYTLRPSYADVWKVLRECDSGVNTLNIVANNDILVPPDAIKKMQLMLHPREAWCLSRYEQTTMRLRPDVYSQDVWAVRGVPHQRLELCDYYFGVYRCDNRIAHDLMAAGYTVKNPCKNVKTYHIHASDLRTKFNTYKNRTRGPGLYVSQHYTGEDATYMIAPPDAPPAEYKMISLVEATAAVLGNELERNGLL